MTPKIMKEEESSNVKTKAKIKRMHARTNPCKQVNGFHANWFTKKYNNEDVFKVQWVQNCLFCLFGHEIISQSPTT